MLGPSGTGDPKTILGLRSIIGPTRSSSYCHQACPRRIEIGRIASASIRHLANSFRDASALKTDMKFEFSTTPFFRIQSLFAVITVCLVGFGWLLHGPVYAQTAGPETADPRSEPDEFFVKQVKPILQEHCWKCHGADPEKIRGSLNLATRQGFLDGGDSGPAVDLEDHSESVFLQAINYEIYEMPPTGKLPDEQIQILTQWVKTGLAFPKSEELTAAAESHSSVPQVNAETKKWWSFQPVHRPAVPEVDAQDWVRNEIDAFILANLEEVSLSPAPPATRQQLIRRAYYDLTGLPPTPAEVDAFVNDADPLAYEKLIDRLLDSPHYGEKWGRHWLDLVRYAESNSFERDGTKPFVWRYRDYVIRAFNDDKPYDQFLIEQLAGDELETPTLDSVIATGYFRLGQWDDEPVDPVQANYDDLDDIVATTSQTMLGLTVNCARCHDHKIDPIPQKDYYQMVSFFENIRRYGVRGDDSVMAASVRIMPGDATESEKQEHQRRTDELQAKLAEIEAIVKPDFEPVEHEDFQYEMNRLPLVEKRVDGLITRKQFNEYRRLTNDLKKHLENPAGSIKVLCVKEKGPRAPESFVRVRGNAAVKGDQVEPAFISVLSPPEPAIETPEHGESTGRRLALAKWIASPDNPLTARVMANRLWQYHFGRGIVRSSGDFGFQGTPPTHPELLDWLADEFVRQGWSIKSLHRLIMNSNAYRMSSAFNPGAYEIDPENDRFWRFNLRRLTAEEIRDSILAVTRQLNLSKMFGPSFFTELPPEVLAGQSRPGQNWGNSSAEDRRRRSIYIHVKRSLPVPILSTNDSADTDNPCPVRFITTQPTQALGLLNSKFTNDQARLFAADIREQFGSLDDQIEAVLSRVMQRTPSAAEIERGVKFIEDLTARENLPTRNRHWNISA